MNQALITACLIIITALGCAHHPASESTGKWGKGTQFSEYSKIYFAGQPDQDALSDASKSGIAVVVNLRSEEEMVDLPFDERKMVQALGMTYYHFPILPGEPFDEQMIEKIEKTVVRHHKKSEKVLVHCASAQRATAWLAIHLVEGHKEGYDQAIAVAKSKGLESKGIIANVKTFLNRPKPTKN